MVVKKFSKVNKINYIIKSSFVIAFLGKESKKRELLDSLPALCRSIEEEYNIPAGDFPDLPR